MTQKLTLPIQVGKKYIRRDGQVVTTTPGVGLKTVGVGDGNFVWEEHGKVWLNNQDTAPADLIADYIEPAAHPHAEAMMEYAKDAAKNIAPWVNWEYYIPGIQDWDNLHDHPAWDVDYKYRRKQPKVTINGIIVNKGVEEVEYLREYFVCSLTRPEKYFTTKHAGVYLKRGIVHTVAEDAIAMAKAMLNFQ